MRCDCCDVLLTTEELKIKLTDGSFANTCRVCLDSADISYKLPKPFYEDDIIKGVEIPDVFETYSEEYWDER
jgi:hypothetical protein